MSPDPHTESFKLLDRAIAVGPPPVEDLVRCGLTRRRRRRIKARSAALAAACATTAIVAVAVNSTRSQEDSQQATAPNNPNIHAEPVPWAGLSPDGPFAPATTPPFEGRAVKVVVETTGDATPGEFYEFVVRLQNEDDATIPLAPCPTYRMQYLGAVELGALNCGAAPKAIGPGEAVAFEMRMPVRDLGVGGPYQLIWQLGTEGAEGAEGSAMVTVD
jgi:hypothetical protein